MLRPNRYKSINFNAGDFLPWSRFQFGEGCGNLLIGRGIETMGPSPPPVVLSVQSKRDKMQSIANTKLRDR